LPGRPGSTIGSSTPTTRSRSTRCAPDRLQPRAPSQSLLTTSTRQVNGAVHHRSHESGPTAVRTRQ
jgi:hypothetical protein